MTADSPIRRHVVYAGHVQGVGFRMTCQTIARRFRVSGWVRNLADGTVELEVQGTADQVRAFLAAVDAEFEHAIRDTRTRELATVAGETSFEIRR